jgi:exosortase D (VPLPA-CTERM-specific)
MNCILTHPAIRVAAIAAALVGLYAAMLGKLVRDWWTDENYSHGLIVPFVIGFIIWSEFDIIRKRADMPQPVLGLMLAFVALAMLLVGTLGAELFSQRISMVLMLAALAIYFAGRKILRVLFVPFLLLLFAIPIPQIIFNKIAFPLQLWASRLADAGIRLLAIESDRKGNVIEIMPLGTDELVGLEVVEACSGIRSLMTLVTLALILAFMTRRKAAGGSWLGFGSGRDLARAVLLMASAVPIALLTNAGRVTITGVVTYYYGQETAEGLWHEVSGWAVYAAAFLLLLAVNAALKKVLEPQASAETSEPPALPMNGLPKSPLPSTAVVLFVLVVGGVFINWSQQRMELQSERRPLSDIPAQLGTWRQGEEDFRFDPETERILSATDYVMRNYESGDRVLNVYVGYYASQRTGATYHSPQSCMPGSGWELSDRQLVDIETPRGRTLTVNRYIVGRGDHREYLIYWYQGRGRATPSEYVDKAMKIWDGITRRRSDGAMIRIMTAIDDDEEASLTAILDLSARLADEISLFVPD